MPIYLSFVGRNEQREFRHPCTTPELASLGPAHIHQNIPECALLHKLCVAATFAVQQFQLHGFRTLSGIDCQHNRVQAGSQFR